MRITLDEKTERLVKKKVQSGQYQRPEDVIRAAVGSLIAQESFGDFKPGELNRLLRAGEVSIKRSGTLDADDALRQRRIRRKKRRAKSK